MTGRTRYWLRGGAAGVIATSGLLLVYTALVKFSDLDAFRKVVESHGIVPAPAQAAVCLAVPAIEFILGTLAVAALATDRGAHVVGLGMVGLLLAFTLYATTSRGCRRRSPRHVGVAFTPDRSGTGFRWSSRMPSRRSSSPARALY